MDQMTGENAVPARATAESGSGLAVLTLAQLTPSKPQTEQDQRSIRDAISVGSRHGTHPRP